jgi:hypothetical protein
MNWVVPNPFANNNLGLDTKRFQVRVWWFQQQQQEQSNLDRSGVHPWISPLSKPVSPQTFGLLLLPQA